MAFTDNTWTCPGGVTKVLVEVWGAGGGGRIGQNIPVTGPGGGGGAYSRKAGISVTAGLGYLARCANTSAMNTNGDDSLFINAATLSAKGGGAGTFGGPGGTGGSAAGGNGDTKYSGGNGAPFTNSVGAGGGGGGSAGRGHDGNNASTFHGGASVDSCGGGGDGGAQAASPTGDGANGTTPGGGGGGGGTNGTATNGGTGGEGAVVIWDDTDGSGWPKCGTPLATYGSPPPDPLCSVPFSYAFFM